MPWYGREFYADERVLVMTLEQEAAYFRLLWNCWQEGSIPADETKLAAICKNISSRKFASMWPALRGCFKENADGRLVHSKVELLRNAKESYRDKCSEAGKRGNERRWGTDRVPDDDPIGSRSKGESGFIAVDCRLPIADKTHCSSADEPLALASPSRKQADEVKVWFDSEFWPAYPRKKAKPQALSAARKHGKTATDRAAIIECLRRQLPVLQDQLREDGDFRPYPASWLNQTPWLDEDRSPAQPKVKCWDSSYLTDNCDE